MKVVSVKTQGPFFQKKNRYKGAMIDATRKILKVVEEEAKLHTPVRTGLLISSIYSTLMETSGFKVAGAVFAGGPRVKYARWVEEGHRLRNGTFLPGVGFMQKGYEKGLKEAEKIVKEEFAKVI